MKRMQNVAGVRNAEMRVSNSQSRKAQNSQYAYQSWLMSRPDEYWDEIVETRQWIVLAKSENVRRSASALKAYIWETTREEREADQDKMFAGMVSVLIDMLCEGDELSHSWEYGIVVNAVASILAQMKRRGGCMAAWAHKQHAPKMSRKLYDRFRRYFVAEA